MTTSFEQEIQNLSTSGYIELFIIDTTVIGGGDIFYYTPNTYTAAPVFWQTIEYTPFPLEAVGFEWNGSSAAPPKPTIRVSNANQFLMAAILSLGDLTGAKVTRFRTFIRFLDDQTDADPDAHYAPDVYLIDQKMTHTKQLIEWSLCSPFDRPGLQLPGRQILKDPTSKNLYAPGVARLRIR